MKPINMLLKLQNRVILPSDKPIKMPFQNANSALALRPRLMGLPLMAYFGFCGLLLLAACQKKETAQVVMKPQHHDPIPFTPPSDGLITSDAARNYALAWSQMVQVNAHLLDSLGAATPERKAVFARALELACENVARRHGLRGVAEYRWIQENAAAQPQNRETLAQVGIAIP
jgi:hypothetical protein